MNPARVSLIVPCYNEADNVELFYEAANKAFADCGYELEIVYVNDGSTDETLKQLKKLANRDDCLVKVVSFSRNFGKESAIYAGFCNYTGNYAVTIDADMQQDPALVLEMLAEIEKDPEIDTVIFYQNHRRESHLMSFIKKLFYKFLNTISEVEFVNGASDFRLFKRNVIDAVLQISEVNRFSKGIFSWVGFNKKYLPYTTNERANGKSKWGFFKLLKYAVSGITSYSSAPLKATSYLGAVLSLLSFTYLVVVVLQKLVWSIGIPGFPTLAGLVLLLGGLQLLGIGIIGQYLAKVFMETKKRPIYIAREIIVSEKYKTAGK